MAALSKLAGWPVQLLTFLATYMNPKTMTMHRFRWILFVLLLVANQKVLPFFWHSRFYASLFRHLLFRRRKLPTPAHLFAPVVMRSRSPLYECDFNLHKSNSTYFSDLDIARTHLVTHLIKKSLRIRRQRGERPMYVALAGVSCLFRREIKPYESYEVWTRVLSWDNKWFWVVSHFVSPGNSKKQGGKDGCGDRKVFASALSKYVFKSDRKTIPPAVVLEESGVLPSRPVLIKEPGSAIESTFGGEESLLGSAEGLGDSILHTRLQHLSSEDPSRASSPVPGLRAAAAAASSAKRSSLGDIDTPASGSSDGKEQGEGDDEIPQLGADRIDVWDWETVEKVRLHGIEIANNMLRLDALEGQFADGNGRSGVKGQPALNF